MELRDRDGIADLEKIRTAAEILIEKGVGRMCVIHFPEGGFAMNRCGEHLYLPSDMMPKSQIVSTVGAGDAFCAGTLYSIHENYPMEKMLRFANTCARFNLKNATSTGGAPTLQEINESLK